MTARRDLKDLIRERVAQTNEKYVVARRHVLAQRKASRGNEAEAQAPISSAAVATEAEATPSLAALLEQLKALSVQQIEVWRVPASAAGTDYAATLARAEDLATNPRYIAESGSVQMSVTRERHDFLIAEGAADSRHVRLLRSFQSPHWTFSTKCKACGRWVWCGETEQEGRCVCGQPFRIVFDLPEHLAMQLPRRMRCCDCGIESTMHLVSERISPWNLLNAFQQQCNRCREKNGAPGPAGALAEQATTQASTDATDDADGETGYFGFADDPDALGMAEEDDPDDPMAGGLAEG